LCKWLSFAIGLARQSSAGRQNAFCGDRVATWR
jgi:hypothetical protein